MGTSPPKGFFHRLIKLICASALFCLGRGNFVFILDTEWDHRAEALVRGDPSETLFHDFFSSPFSSFFLFMQYEYSPHPPPPKKKNRYIDIDKDKYTFFQCCSSIFFFLMIKRLL